jgi:hypothetical protein
VEEANAVGLDFWGDRRRPAQVGDGERKDGRREDPSGGVD